MTDDDTRAITDPDLLRRLNEHGVARYSDNAIFSMSLPANFNYSIPNPNSSSIVIRDGILISGNVTDQDAAAITDILQKTYGTDAADKFTNRLSSQGKINVSYKVEIAQKLREAETKLLQLPKGETYYEKLHYADEIKKITDELTVLATTIGMDPDELVKNNVMLISVISGAKGSMAHVTQIGVSMGMQTVGGRDQPKTVTEGKRTTAHGIPGRVSADSLGFVGNSFKDGMDPREAYYASAAGREQTTATNAPTKTNGKIQRNIQNSMANIVTFSGGVFSGNDIMLDPCAGGDAKSGTQILFVVDRLQSVAVGDYMTMLNTQTN